MAGAEILPGPSQQSGLEGVDAPKINAIVGKMLAADVVRIDQSVANQMIGAQQRHISGEGRKALVGRVPGPGRAKRNNLPPRLTCAGESVLVGGGLDSVEAIVRLKKDALVDEVQKNLGESCQ